MNHQLTVILFWMFYIIVPIVIIGIPIYQIVRRHKGRSQAQFENEWESMIDHKNGE